MRKSLPNYRKLHLSLNSHYNSDSKYVSGLIDIIFLVLMKLGFVLGWLGWSSGNLDTFLASRLELDRFNMKSAPRIHESIEYVPGLGTISLGGILGRGAASVVFAIVEFPEMVIKYQANCFDPDGIHPLIRDEFFGLKAFQVGVGVEPMFLSPPVQVPHYRTTKTDFFSACGGTELRFIIMQRVDSCFAHGQAGSIPLALTVGTWMVSLLHKLHTQAGVIHGDVHAGNVCTLTRDEAGMRVVLIDYEHAKFVSEETDVRALSQVPPHASQSPWELIGFETSRRDDIYNALSLVGDLMADGSVWKHAENLSHSGRFNDLVEWRANGLIYTSPVDLITRGLETEEQVRNVKYHLHAAMQKVLELVSSKSEINYYAIFDDLFRALEWTHVA